MSRKIIIPKGIIEDVNQHYVIEIPTNLSNGTGNLIAKKKGNKIVAQQLPDWQDDLGSPYNNFVAEAGRGYYGRSSAPMGQYATNYGVADAAPVAPPSFYYNTRPRAPAATSSPYPGAVRPHNVACYNSPLDPNPSGASLEISTPGGYKIRSNIQANVGVNDYVLASVVERIENDDFEGPACGCDHSNGTGNLVRYENEVEEEIYQ